MEGHGWVCRARGCAVPGHTQSEDKRVRRLALFEAALGRAPWSRSGPVTRVSAWGSGSRPGGWRGGLSACGGLTHRGAGHALRPLLLSGGRSPLCALRSPEPPRPRLWAASVGVDHGALCPPGSKHSVLVLCQGLWEHTPGPRTLYLVSEEKCLVALFLSQV